MSLTSLRICLLGAFVGAAFVTLGLLSGQAPASALENDLLPDPAGSSVSSAMAEVSTLVDEATDAVLPPVKQLANAPLAPAAPPSSPAPAPAPAPEAVAPLPTTIAEVAAPVVRPVQDVLDAEVPALQGAVAPVVAPVAPVADAVEHVVDRGGQQVAELPLPLGLAQAVLPVDPGSALDILDPVASAPLPGILPLGPTADGTPLDLAAGPSGPVRLDMALGAGFASALEASVAAPVEASGVVDVWSTEADAAAASAADPVWPLQPGGPAPGSPSDALPGSGTSAGPGSGAGAASAALLLGTAIPAPGYGRALLSLAATSWRGGVDLEPGSTPD